MSTAPDIPAQAPHPAQPTTTTPTKKPSRWPLVFLGVLIGLGLLYAAIISTPRGLNSNPPDYMKEVGAYQEGSDGIVVYFLLGDAQTNTTSSDGKAVLSIADAAGEPYHAEQPISKNDFVPGTRGGSTTAPDLVGYTFGRLAYDKFSRQPQDKATVTVTFTPPSGKAMEGKATVTLSK